MVCSNKPRAGTGNDKETREAIINDNVNYSKYCFQFAKIMQHATRGELPERDRAMLACMLGTGMRRAECQQLLIEDVVLEADGSGYVTVRKAKEVKGRNTHQRRVAFDASTGFYLRTWLDSYPVQSGWLWPSYSKIEKKFSDQPLSLRGFNRVVDKIYRAADFALVLFCVTNASRQALEQSFMLP